MNRAHLEGFGGCTVCLGFPVEKESTVNPIKLEAGLRPNSAGIPYTLLLRIEAIGFPTFRLLLYSSGVEPDT